MFSECNEPAPSVFAGPVDAHAARPAYIVMQQHDLQMLVISPAHLAGSGHFCRRIAPDEITNRHPDHRPSSESVQPSRF
jgi:hypothetical protein